MSMTALAMPFASHTMHSSLAADGGGAVHLSVGGLLVLVGLLYLTFFTGNRRGGGLLDRRTLRALRGERGMLAGTITGLFKTGWGLLRFTLRFVTGRPLNGEPTSDATFWRAGTAPMGPAGRQPAATLGSIAAPAPKVSLVKRQPSPWVRQLTTTAVTYKGKGAQLVTIAGIVVVRVVAIVRGTVRVVRFVTGALQPVVTSSARAVATYRRWPHVGVAVARVAGLAVTVGLLLPTTRTRTVLALLGAVLVVVALALTGPYGARWWRTSGPSDAKRYGPALWAVLRNDLKLTEQDRLEEWMYLPHRLADPDARIVIRLPWSYRGTQVERDQLTEFLNSRVPGEWVGKWDFKSEDHTVVFTHKPPPKPAVPDPEPPTAVDIWDPHVQEILANLGPDEFYCGQDENDQPVIQKMADEQAHWAVSVGSGGGKSAFLQWLAIQMLMKRGTAILMDPKMVSMTPLIDADIDGVHCYIDPENIGDMRATITWVTEVTRARNYEKKTKTRTEFPPLYLILEECNTLADYLKGEYLSVKESGNSAADPIWRDGVVKILALGREVNVHIIAVFQDFRDTQFGGQALSGLFPFKIMGSYSKKQWDRIIGTNFSMPTPVKKAGRMVIVKDTGETTRIQTPYAPWNPELTKDENQQKAYRLLTAYYKELRATHGYSTAGLYTTPPEPSPEVAPALVQAASRDKSPDAPWWAPERGQGDETAGHDVTGSDDVTATDGSVTAARDRLRLIPGQATSEPADPMQAPRLLTLAEVARELEARGFSIKENTMRQHKSRRESTGFPVGVEIDGKEKFTVAQILYFYQQRGAV